MKQRIAGIKGMNDILPQDVGYWQYIEAKLAEIAHRYGFEEIRLPILEKTDLFKRSVGEQTDIVEKEMFTLQDSQGHSISMRPEGTACCVRAAIQHGLLRQAMQKFWYMGPYFRHERPQKGRYRQFHQFGVEVFGPSSWTVEFELIALNYALWQELGIADDVYLQINTIGTASERQNYRQALIEYFEGHYHSLDEDSQRRLYTNPLRILDSKNTAIQDLVTQAPRLWDYLSEDSQSHYQALQHQLQKAGIPFEFNPNLVRGLDYYSHTVFEWVTDHLGAQATVCAGGRYNYLVEQLGGDPTPAVGFGLGLERLLLLLTQLERLPNCSQPVDFYLIGLGDAPSQSALLLAERIRQQLPERKLVFQHNGGSLKNQLKKANQAQAQIALIMGDEEYQEQQVTVKFLQSGQPQTTVACAELIDYLSHNV